MDEIIIKGIGYNVTHTVDKIILQRYNEKHKTWVSLHFPKGKAEGQKIDEDIIQVLSNLYIERNVREACGDT